MQEFGPSHPRPDIILMDVQVRQLRTRICTCCLLTENADAYSRRLLRYPRNQDRIAVAQYARNSRCPDRCHDG